VPRFAQSLVGEPDFYCVAVERLRARNFFQAIQLDGDLRCARSSFG